MRSAATSAIEKRNFSDPDEIQSFDKGLVDYISAGGITWGRSLLRPGWKWSESVKPVAGSESCDMSHLQYIVSGTLHIETDDGEEAECGPGDIVHIGPGHNAWVVGKEPVVAVEIRGMERLLGHP